MAATLAEIDRAWAWSAYQPNAQQPWDRRRAAHLFRRAGFAATANELDVAVGHGPEVTIAALFAPPEGVAAFNKQSDSLAETVQLTGKPQNLAAWWLHRMLQTPQPLVEKMTLFWHGHFATSGAKVEQAANLLAQNQLLRREALGKFDQLTQDVSRDPAMLLYLDSATNRKQHPNENYARELMELFCMGIGNYTEQDIRELARCFTGAEVRDGRYRFSPLQHDSQSKSLFAQTGPWKSTDAVRIVVAQPATPVFITRKLCKFFICDEPELPTELIQPLADEFRRRELDLAWLVRQILSSQLFFSQYAVGRKIRSPVELGIGLLRSLEGATSMYRLRDLLADCGQAVFFPPNVKGWDGGRSWLNASTLLTRANMVRELVLDGKSRFADGDLATLAKKNGWTDTRQALDGLVDLLVAVPLSEPVRAGLLATARKDAAPTAAAMGQLIHSLSLLPEFQLA